MLRAESALHPQFTVEAYSERRVARGLGVGIRCLKPGRWPGEPDGWWQFSSPRLGRSERRLLSRTVPDVKYFHAVSILEHIVKDPIGAIDDLSQWTQ